MPETNEQKTRVRVGIKLPWPLVNAATFVAYLTPDQFEKANGAVFTIKVLFPQASALFIEKS